MGGVNTRKKYASFFNQFKTQEELEVQLLKEYKFLDHKFEKIYVDENKGPGVILKELQVWGAPNARSKFRAFSKLYYGALKVKNVENLEEVANLLNYLFAESVFNGFSRDKLDAWLDTTGIDMTKLEADVEKLDADGVFK